MSHESRPYLSIDWTRMTAHQRLTTLTAGDLLIGLESHPDFAQLVEEDVAMRQQRNAQEIRPPEPETSGISDDLIAQLTTSGLAQQKPARHKRSIT